MLEIDRTTLYRYIRAGKITAPRSKLIGGFRVRIWTDRDIDRVRKQLPKIANGRRKKKKRKK